MTAEEFVRRLDGENQALLGRLAPDDTLRPEVTGDLTVVNLLKVALKNEIEATEIAARWLVATDDVAMKLALARQVENLGIPVIEDQVVSRLLVTEGNCFGAMAFDLVRLALK